MRETINIGTAPFDPSADNLQVGGAKINSNFQELYSKFNGIISIGTITNEGNVYTVPAGAEWSISGIDYTNALPYIFTVADASPGFKRIDLLIVRPSGFELVVGTESAGVVNPPDITDSANAIEVKPYFINGTDIDDGSEPVVGEGYVSQRNFAEIVFSGSGRTTLSILPNLGGIRFTGANTSFEGVNVHKPENLWPGKPFKIKNMQAISMTLKHLTGTVFQMSFPGGTDLVAKPGEIICFEWYPKTDGSWELQYIGHSDLAEAKAYADTKQAQLVSGTNIKTVNGESILGSGDLKVKRTAFIRLGFATTSLAASSQWFVSTRESSNLLQLVMTTDSTYNNTTRTLGEGRASGDIIPFNCKVKSIRWASGTIGTPITINVHSWIPAGSSTSANFTVGSKTIASTTGGENFDFTGSEIDTATMLAKGARISAFLFNNNVATGALRYNLLLIEIEEVL
ncbi:hypothetical protein ASG38_14960 [Flavobacterium sp. Leaf359]|uniref:hypothetical protein n=1 Tax=Flavobacterium sp. Leaf359 TaxID=1736351 RepID=UPI000700CBD5|nr:hypothetical protein [Flavobacterium sp. Leaf359]KQS45907.1 hypothetical protein ASG38_14960 [Flavobacterium sp. Leaf359]